jgi:hypothetical protein
MKRIYTILLLLFISITAFAQDKQLVVPITVVNGDTMPYVILQEVAIKAKLTRKLKRAIAQNEKLIRNVRKTMPLAISCRNRLQNIDMEMAKLPTRELQKKYYEQAEAGLKADFEGQLKKLTYSQGKMLIKLIDRETGKTPYKLIRKYKSNYTAVFWQSFATVFGMNLNKEYDAEDDAEIEFIIKWLGYN